MPISSVTGRIWQNVIFLVQLIGIENLSSLRTVAVPTLLKSGRWHFHQDNAPVHNSILVKDYLTQMGIKTVPYPPYSPALGPWDFWLFPKLKGWRWKRLWRRSLARSLKRNSIGSSRGCWKGTAGGDYVKRGLEFHVCTINKSAHTKKVWKHSFSSYPLFTCNLLFCLLKLQRNEWLKGKRQIYFYILYLYLSQFLFSIFTTIFKCNIFLDH